MDTKALLFSFKSTASKPFGSSKTKKQHPSGCCFFVVCEGVGIVNLAVFVIVNDRKTHARKSAYCLIQLWQIFWIIHIFPPGD